MGTHSVAIILLTYRRTEFAVRTLKALQENLVQNNIEQLHLHVADDGSDQAHLDAISSSVCDMWDSVSWTNAERSGYGASYNLATQVVHQKADILLPIEDDWELIRPLGLGPLVRALEDPRIGCIRMGYLGYTQPLRGECVVIAGHNYLLLDPDSQEPHVFAGHPRLETRDWQRAVGPWPEHLEQGTTEFHVAHRKRARIGVAWPLDFVLAYGDLFAHIGSERA